MNFVEPKRGKKEKSKAKLHGQLRRLKEIFLPSNFEPDVIENVWLASAKDFELSLKRISDLADD